MEKLWSVTNWTRIRFSSQQPLHSDGCWSCYCDCWCKLTCPAKSFWRRLDHLDKSALFRTDLHPSGVSCDSLVLQAAVTPAAHGRRVLVPCSLVEIGRPKCLHPGIICHQLSKRLRRQSASSILVSASSKLAAILQNFRLFCTDKNESKLKHGSILSLAIS